jgi:hypothetical protein
MKAVGFGDRRSGRGSKAGRALLPATKSFSADVVSEVRLG